MSYYWWCVSSFCRITFHYSNQLVWQTSTVNGNNRCFCLQIRNCCIYFPVFGRTVRVFRSVFGYENMSNAIIRNTHNKKSQSNRFLKLQTVRNSCLEQSSMKKNNEQSFITLNVHHGNDSKNSHKWIIYWLMVCIQFDFDWVERFFLLWLDTNVKLPTC